MQFLLPVFGYFKRSFNHIRCLLHCEFSSCKLLKFPIGSLLLGSEVEKRIHTYD